MTNSERTLFGCNTVFILSSEFSFFTFLSNKAVTTKMILH